RRNLPYKVICYDDTGEITLIWFNSRRDYLEELLPVDREIIISGTIEEYKNSKQIIHPDHIIDSKKNSQLPEIEATYSLTQGLTNKVVRNNIQRIIHSLPKIDEWHDQMFLKERNWPSLNDALINVHNPKNNIDLTSKNPAKERLIYDELLAHQISLYLISNDMYYQKGIPTKSNVNLINKFIDSLPFKITNSQHNCINQITEDMESSNRMLRLLQGDVGSGKTLVALISILNCVNDGKQVALMVPTELLANQHYESFSELLSDQNFKINLLTGKTNKSDKEIIYKNISNGKTDIIIGTHALFQEEVNFVNLGFVAIDEQHKFGVHQRLLLTSKNEKLPPDVLLMTATPIPRTLELTTYGSMSVSKITEKPKGRQNIVTAAKPASKINETIKSLKKTIDKNNQVYWVCPLIEESEKIDLAAAEKRYESLKKYYPDNVLLVHGRMKPEEREVIMEKFRSGKKKILVSTTVIEVGIDIPEATVMIIEHSERFGLSQLHQLRGRVGRGKNQSSCLLLYQTPLGENAKKRINTLRETNDGFIIAEKDLLLRGSGEVLGTRQSGFHIFKIANLNENKDLLEIANENAKKIIENNLLLENKKYKQMLKLFSKDESLKYLDAG
ncbi:MAG: ATP-dependent DNA helicase RecG, partial [Pseudomonadota bacterium]|nr:ATP-dependent DNA helicase RecG [Pseudomonadota bacterium]